MWKTDMVYMQVDLGYSNTKIYTRILNFRAAIFMTIISKVRSRNLWKHNCQLTRKTDTVNMQSRPVVLRNKDLYWNFEFLGRKCLDNYFRSRIYKSVKSKSRSGVISRYKHEFRRNVFLCDFKMVENVK